jgi:DNA-binding NarL/FixJ family response regulator
MIRVQIIDDHKMLVEGLCKLINESGVALVTNVSYNAADCSRMLAQELPNVLLLDINLPDANGVDLCKELIVKYPSLKILALSSYGEYSVVRRMMENGAMGYVLKNAMSEEVLAGITAVANGEKFMCHDVDVIMKKKENDAIWLTARERELLKLIVEGYTNPEIAETIFLSPETIKGYRKNLLFKLGAKNTATLVKMAIEQRLI